MPTGVAIADAREVLFRAAETLVARDGPAALTSRAVTAEAGVAKGVLHRHFADFDTFLAELALDRAGRIQIAAAALAERAGSGDVVGNLTASLDAALGPLALAIVGLVICRGGLRARLAAAGETRLPLVAETTVLVAGYLRAEQQAQRVAADADADAVAPLLVGAAHLLLAGRDVPADRGSALRGVVEAALRGVLRAPRPARD